MNEPVNLAERVGQAISARKLFRRGQSILVAVSGGLDSMALLHLLADLAAAHRWRLTVAHFNHQLRGRGSDADERLVQRTVKKLRLPFVVARADVKEHARKNKISIEMAARNLRHEFLARVAKERRIPVIALAHHADDQVELFFIRLLRGSGGEGLSGMKWQSRSPANPKITLVRPLLDQPKSALEHYAKSKRIAFREDTSNSQLDIQRNRIRRELLPLLKRHYQPALERVILRQMEILGAEAEFVNQAASATHNNRSSRCEETLIFSAGEKKVRVSSRRLLPRATCFNDLPVAIQRRRLQLQLAPLGITPNFDLIEQLRTHANRPVNVNQNLSVQRDAAGQVSVPESGSAAVPAFNDRAFAVRFEGRAGEIAFESAVIFWKLRNAPTGTFRAPKSQVNCECFDADKLGSDIKLRHWLPGDRFQPIGMAAPVKLQDLFSNQKVPRTRRHQLLVGATGEGEIFWVEGQRLSERFKLDKNKRYELHWCWKRLL